MYGKTDPGSSVWKWRDGSTIPQQTGNLSINPTMRVENCIASIIVSCT